MPAPRFAGLYGSKSGPIIGEQKAKHRMYVELHMASAFSFLQGASSPEALVDRAAALGYSAVALVDRDGLYGAPRFHKAATAAGLKPIIGAELTMTSGDSSPLDVDRSASSSLIARRSSSSPVARRSSFVLPVLVSSRTGYQNLSRLISTMKLNAPKGEGALTLEALDGRVEGLVALAGRQLLHARQHGVGGLLDRLIGIFGRDHVYVELQRHLDRDEAVDNESLTDLAAAYRVPLVVANGVRFAAPDERPLHDVFTCLYHKTTLASAGRRLVGNAERYLKSPERIAALFSDRPEAVAASRALAERLEYTMADLGYRFPEYPVPSGETMPSFLRKIAEVGARERYRPYHDRARAQIARELDLIEKLDLAGYFLIVWDIVNFCRQRGILVQGRGSAANSAVCYSLGITAVDPVGMDLLFERFLSEERGEWPDIDLDLPSGDRREQVIQYVFQRYGKLGAAMTANVITYRSRSATREVGKVLGFDEALIDRLAKLMNRFEYVDGAETLSRHFREVGVGPGDPGVRHFVDLWQRMQDLPRHLGQHSGGMVICQGRLDAVVPLENASMPDRVVVQWDKEDCADMGLIKVDLLGLGMMAVLQDALVLVNGAPGTRHEAPHQAPGTEHQAPTLDLAHLPPDDPVVYKMLQQADTIGLFQVESRAQMATLPRLKPACFYDLVVQVAIIRPGPHRRADGASVPEPARGARAGRVRASLARADSRAHARRAALPGTAAADGDGRRGVHRWTGRRTAPRDGVQAIGEAYEGDREAAQGRHGPERHHGRNGRADHHVDRVVRALRVPRIARGQLRAHRLRERVPESALPGGVLRGAAQQPADGVLSSGDAGERRAAAWRALRAHRRRGVRLGVHDRDRRASPARPALRRRPARAGGPRHRRSSGGAAAPAGPLPEVRV